MRKILLPKKQFALISSQDWSKISKIRWSITPVKNGQGKTYSNFVAYYRKTVNNKRITIYMHNLIMKPKIGYEVDHIDGNTLNNQRSNLRVVTHQQNCMNRKPKNNKQTSKYKGVDFHKGKFRARIRVHDKELHLGYFNYEVMAALAYDQAAKTYFKRFAKLNFYE